MTTQFHPVRFPVALSYGATGGPETRTEIITSRSGAEERNSTWSSPRRRYDAGLSLRSLDDLDQVVSFFNARQGRLYGFLWKDWSDFKSSAPLSPISPLDQVIGTGDGATTVFQLKKTYFSGPIEFVRTIKKPVENTVQIALDQFQNVMGQDFSVDYETGKIQFMTAPGAGVTITAGYEFDLPARFDTDYLPISISSFEAGQITSIPVVELMI